VEESIPIAQIEQLVIKVVESRLQQAMEEHVEKNAMNHFSAR
jgi:hypothetical protein